MEEEERCLMDSNDFEENLLPTHASSDTEETRQWSKRKGLEHYSLLLATIFILSFFIMSLSNKMDSIIPILSLKRAPEEILKIPPEEKSDDDNELPNLVNGYDLTAFTIKTANGRITMEEANENVFHSFGYQIIEANVPVPRLAYLRKEQTCEKAYSEWMALYNQSVELPNLAVAQGDLIPENLTSSFLLNGYATLKYVISNSAELEKSLNWNRIGDFMSWDAEKIAKTAGGRISAMHNAMRNYKLKNTEGLVLGSIEPWAEILAMKHGAKKLLTVSPAVLEIQEEYAERIKSIQPMDLAGNWEKYAGTFDFAVAISTMIESSGLGRYGTPLDPIGDLREMEKIKCLLKNDGLLFLGVPMGTDAVTFNIYRTYGPLRLAMIFIGFEWIGTFNEKSPSSLDLSESKLHRSTGKTSNFILVLKKIEMI